MKRIIFLLLTLCIVIQGALAVNTLIDKEEMDFRTNIFTSTEQQALGSLIPFVLLIVCLVSFMIDFGTVGVTFGSMLGLVASTSIGIINIGIPQVIAFCVMGAILIFKLRS